MFNSEITVFKDRDYYEQFFIHDSKYFNPKVIKDKNRSILKEFNIQLPSNIILEKRGYIETCDDEDEKYQDEMWAIG